MDNIQLENLTTQDEDFVYKLFSDPNVLRNYNSAPIKNIKDTKDFILANTEGQNKVWKILYGPEKLPIGICGLHHYNEKSMSIEIGGTLFPEFWGKGIMKNVFEKLIIFAQKEYGVRTIVGKTSQNNLKAINMVRKLGFNLTETIGREATMVLHLKQP